MIYFIQSGEDGPVKIGFTNGNPLNRLRSLQIGSHQELFLRAVVSGDEAAEAKLHRRFAKQRVRGEWFRPVPSLVKLIEKHAPPRPPEPEPDAPPEPYVVPQGSTPTPVTPEFARAMNYGYIGTFVQDTNTGERRIEFDADDYGKAYERWRRERKAAAVGGAR